MEKYSAIDLVRIIKACKASGVSEVKVGDIEIKFGVSPDQEVRTGETAPVPTAEQLREAEELANVQENISTTEDELAMLQLEDPVKFEQLLIQRELESGRQES